MHKQSYTAQTVPHLSQGALYCGQTSKAQDNVQGLACNISHMLQFEQVCRSRSSDGLLATQ